MLEETVNSLGRYPILQVAISAIVIGTWALMITRGLKTGSRDNFRFPFMSPEQWFVENQIRPINEKLKRIFEHVQEMKTQHAQQWHDLLAVAYDIRNILREIRDQERGRK